MNEPSDKPTDLYGRLLDMLVGQLEGLLSNDALTDEEKRARSFASYVKALETIVTIGTKMNVVGAGNFDPILNGAGDLAPGSQATDTAELDRNLAQFIGKLVEAGKAE